ncbi:hypothetical protein KY289_033761 [Solanum tuberosum]|nr:hypothetical protein KY289_033761 [Solanum tuberosum]
MAEAFLQVLLGNITSFIQGELVLLFGLENDFKKLSSTFSTIQLVLEDASEKQLKDKAIENWLQKLNFAAYEVDDILDECKNEAARFKQSLLGCIHPKIIIFRYKLGKRMKRMMEKLDAIADERRKFHLREKIVEKQAAKRETGFVLAEPKVYGRDKEKDEMVKILINSMHDLIHDLATSLFSTNTRSSKIRQIRVAQKNTMSIGFAEVVPSYSPLILKRFVSLRVLDMKFSKVDHLTSSIGDLIHLRLLNLHGSSIRSLPKRLCKLQNLQTFDISCCFSLSYIPKQISKLSSLRNLVFKGCQITSMPPRIGSLTCLKTLDYFIVGERKGYQIGELRNLNLHGSLSITHLERVKSDTDAKEANLSTKKKLYNLCMSWDIRPYGYESENNLDEKVLEALRPHSNLKSLKLIGFRGFHFPNWMNASVLKNVVSIEIECENCWRLPPFGELPCLESLKLYNGSAEVEYIEEDDGHSTSKFLYLKRLAIERFPNLKGLLRSEGEEKFSMLEEMEIWHCPMFVFPAFSSVKKLDVWGEIDAASISSISKLTTLTSLSIDHNFEATTLPEEMFKRLVNLESLSIIYFKKLRELPSSLASLSALKCLKIHYCYALESLLEQGMEGLTSLTNLYVQNSIIHYCPMLVFLTLACIKKLEVLSSIFNLITLTSLCISHNVEQTSLAEEMFKHSWIFQDEFENLKSTFTTIQVVLEDAQEKQLNDKQLENWLQKLNVAAYEVDDILDECKTKAARLNQTKYGCYPPKVITFRHKVGKRMKEMMEKLDAIAAERRKFHLEKRTIEREAARRETGFVSTEQKVYGRDKEEDEIVKILINNISDAQELSVLPILGMGRLGKTTLAQMVFNDRRVTEHFHPKIWICVSDDFDEKKLIKAFVESIEGRALDQEKWDNLKAVLMVGASGASVLTTTRLEKVGSIMGTLQPYQLSNMSQEDCWLLFMQRAFGHHEKINPDLVAIGKEIVKKCGGVPLAAKTLEGILHFKREEREWEHVRDSEIWNLPQDEIFPKDTEMEKEKLISLWMEHGFLSSKGNLVLEDVASASSSNICEINAKSYTHKMSIGFAEVTLSRFVVGRKKGCQLGELRNLNLYGSIEIKQLERVKNDKDAKEANLSSKGNLHSLIMSWDKYEPHRYESEEAKVLEALKPYPNLTQSLASEDSITQTG